MFSTRPPTSKSSSPFNSPLVTVPNASIKIGIIVTFISHRFLKILWQGWGTYPSFPFLSVLFCGQLRQQRTILQVLFLLITIKPGLLAIIRWSVCMSKSYRGLCMSCSRIAAGLCMYHLFVWTNVNFLHISQGITLPTQSCLVLYSFCANFLFSLIMWLMVSSLSPHNLYLLFCSVLSILALIWLVLMALFCAAIRDSLSLLKFQFLSHIHVFSCEMSLINRSKHQ